MPNFSDRMPKPNTGMSFQLQSGGEESFTGWRGDVILTLTDAQTGEVVQHIELESTLGENPTNG